METRQKEIALKHRRTKKGLIGEIYNVQKAKSRKRKHLLPNYTLQELREATLNMPLFHTLYNAWVESGYLKELKPSYDRDDPKLPYSKDNISLMTWKENHDKATIDRKKGVEIALLKRVDQFSLDNKYITTYHSIAEAARITGINNGSISECCTLKRKTAGKFKWKHSKD